MSELPDSPELSMIRTLGQDLRDVALVFGTWGTLIGIPVIWGVGAVAIARWIWRGQR